MTERAVGMRGGVRLRAELVGGRTRITELGCRPPLQVLRAHHVDPIRPDLASVILASPAGGILQGDRISIDISVGPGARLRVGTQSASRVYRAPAAEATQVARFEVGTGAHLEYLPEPWIPYAGSRLCSRTTVVLDDGGSAILGETIGPGRVARGEILALDRFESIVEILRPDGTLLATDAVVLDGGRAALGRIGLLGEYLALGTVLILRSGVDPDLLRSAAEGAARALASVRSRGPAGPAGQASPEFGASSLPNAAGAWLRVLAADHRDAAAIVAAAAEAAHTTLTAPLAA